MRSFEFRWLFVANTEAGVAFTSKMVTPKPAANNEFMFQKIFGDGDFIAAGQLIIPVGGKKPSKGTKDNTYVGTSIMYASGQDAYSSSDFLRY